MTTKNLAGRVMVLAASAVMATFISGCAPFQSNPSQSHPSAGSTAPASNPSLSMAAGAATQDATPKCVAASLKASMGGRGGAAMMHVQTAVQFTNIGSTSCVIKGFPGVSYVTGDNGEQVGAPADRDGAIGALVILAPGQTAHAPLYMLNGIGAYPPDDPSCQPTPVRGIRVFPPDETAALFIAGDNTVCGNPSNHTMTVRTVQAGDGATR